VSKHKQVTPTGATAAKDPVEETAGWATFEKKVPIEAKPADKGGTLRTLEGPARYSRGDFIARGAKGEKWPIRKDVFAKTYRRIGAAVGFKKKASAANIRDNKVSAEDAHEGAESVGASKRVNLKALRRGMQVEVEHQKDPETNVVKGDPKRLTRIAWAHLKEDPKYYEKLERVEKKADDGATSHQSFGVFSPRAAAYLSQPRVTGKFRALGFAEEAGVDLSGVAVSEEGGVG
jgi:hypothetical protein